jgi:hypothetical protein
MEIRELIAEGMHYGLSFFIDDEGDFCIEGSEEVEGLALLILERKFEAIQILSSPPPTSAGHCQDCGEKRKILIARLCFRCGELRKFLANKLPCDCVAGVRWRYVDNGIYWHCSKHEPAPGNALWSRKEKDEVSNVVKFESARKTKSMIEVER